MGGLGSRKPGKPFGRSDALANKGRTEQISEVRKLDLIERLAANVTIDVRLGGGRVDVLLTGSVNPRI